MISEGLDTSEKVRETNNAKIYRVDVELLDPSFLPFEHSICSFVTDSHSLPCRHLSEDESIIINRTTIIKAKETKLRNAEKMSRR